MLNYPQIDPVALAIGPLKIHWYGLMYLLGFMVAWGLACYRADRSQGAWTRKDVEDFLFFGFLGVLIGGRLGYALFYDFSAVLDDPLRIFKIWQGGMSFHGGLVGVLLAMGYFARKTKRHFWQVADFFAPAVPIALGLGRLGNFINGELWGRVTQVPWAMVPPGEMLARHPSQLYELLLEGIVLFIVVWLFSSKPRREGAVSSVFLIGYALARITVEFFRQPDANIGFLFGWLTLGQLLTLPLLVLGLYLLGKRA